MLKEEIEAELAREPFVPLRLYLRNGKKLPIPVREAALVMKDDMLVVIGAKPQTHQAKGYLTFDFDQVVRIEQLRGGKDGQGRRKAS